MLLIRARWGNQDSWRFRWKPLCLRRQPWLRLARLGSAASMCVCVCMCVNTQGYTQRAHIPPLHTHTCVHSTQTSPHLLAHITYTLGTCAYTFPHHTPARTHHTQQPHTHITHKCTTHITHRHTALYFLQLCSLCQLCLRARNDGVTRGWWGSGVLGAAPSTSFPGWLGLWCLGKSRQGRGISNLPAGGRPGQLTPTLTLPPALSAS